MESIEVKRQSKLTKINTKAHFKAVKKQHDYIGNNLWTDKKKGNICRVFVPLNLPNYWGITFSLWPQLL